MGSEQSNNRNSSETQHMSQAEVQRLFQRQRLQYEKKCQELLAQATAQNSQRSSPQPTTSTVERNSAPYSYTREDLQNIRDYNTPQTLYPNLNAAASTTTTFSFQNNNNQRNTRPNDYVFVNNNGTERFRPAPSAPPAARDRSVSRSRNANNNRNTEGDELNCPSCGSMFGMVIYQCGSGHSACNDCKIGGRVCRLCGQGITNMRNFDLEGYVAQRKVPCPNTADGCRLYIKLADRETHMRECPFKEQTCPLASVFGNCHWKGRLNQIAGHFDMMHPTHRQTNVDSELRLMNICNNSQQLHLVLLGVYNFVFHVKVSEIDRSIYMTVQLIGTKMSASKWYYEVHVYNKNECRRKYSFTDNCSSSSEPVNDIFREKKCAVLPLAYASTFINDGSLSYKFFIKKNNEGPKDFGKNQRGRGKN